MNNVICIVVDSVYWDCVSKNRTKVSTTPFVDSLRSESVVANNLYSHGPYTDAATKSLYTGRNTLDDYGYYFKINSAANTHFDVFHKNGFETYGQYYPYYIYGPKSKKSIDYPFYTTGFFFGSEWRCGFDHYKDILSSRELTKIERMLLKKRTQLMFDTWLDFYNDIITNSKCAVLIAKGLENIDIKETYEELKKEYDTFKKDPQKYIMGILREGNNHRLASIDNIDVRASIDYEYIKKQVYEKNCDLFNRIRRNTRIANIKHNRPGIIRIMKGVLKYISSHNKNDLRFVANFLHCLSALDDMMENSKMYFWQNISSTRKQLENVIDVLKNRNSEQPFYYSLHLLDPHEYICFFSYDIQNDAVLEEEFDMLREFVENCGTNFKGSLPYLLSIRYVDYCIEMFCNDLKEMGLWDSTTIMITADHGSSYSYFPLHGRQVNNFDEECYHIPMIIRSPGMKGVKIDHYCNSKDAFPTLFDIVGLEKPESFIGNSIIDDDFEPDNYVMTEYMGPGCPDMLSKEAWLSIRDCNYLVAYKAKLSEDFNSGEIAEVYDLKKDPRCYYNIHDKVAINDIRYLINIIEGRFNDIREGIDVFLEEQLDENRQNH